MLTRRTTLRTAAAGLVAGLTLVGAAWAGVAIAPSQDDPTGGALDPITGLLTTTTAPAPASGSTRAVTPGLRAGAAKVSIAPKPPKGATWERDLGACRTLDPGYLERIAGAPDELAHLAGPSTSPWPENPDCIYQGGFGIGPMNPVSGVDANGLWVRSVAIGDGRDTIVLTIIDGEGWLWDYGSKCTDCGAKQLRTELGSRLGINPAGIVIAATHSHAAPDFIGGWGFVPDWYMAQVTQAIRTSVTRAVKAMEPAAIETGEVMARQFNGERRDTYRSAEEQQLGWLRAYTPAKTVKGKAVPARTIATLGAYAAHPTTKGTNGGIASADWVGEFEKELERRFGGIGLHFMTGLGNMSARDNTGKGLAGLVPALGKGNPVTAKDVWARQETWLQPATNIPLTTLGLPGFFDRKFQQVPSTVQAGKSENAPCVSASPITVEVVASLLRIGDDLAITTGPGELFSNLTNTIKEKSPTRLTLPLAQANDALGYIPQSFELNPVGQQGLGFALGGYVFVNYEDSYAIDRCFGDAVLERTLGLLAQPKP